MFTHSHNPFYSAHLNLGDRISQVGAKIEKFGSSGQVFTKVIDEIGNKFVSGGTPLFSMGMKATGVTDKIEQTFDKILGKSGYDKTIAQRRAQGANVIYVPELAMVLPRPVRWKHRFDVGHKVAWTAPDVPKEISERAHPLGELRST